jgi:tRNA G18 (ribose-2'-O)-methylase SpoU
MSRPSVVLILHDLRSAHNVGAIFRTADSIGVEKIYLTGYTPAPVDQFGRANKEIAKTALGAEQTLPWEKTEDIFELTKKLQANSYKLLALEQSPQAVDYKTITIADPTAIILGNEVAGINPEILAACDQVAQIPMRGTKESLNVAVACGIALFRWLDR